MAYNAYERFLAAAKTFPQWTNLRRRPIDSNAGKILRSIIEEIEAVEDAIIEYKKDFFIVNYEGREDTILDYIYIAQVGDIETIDTFFLDNPSYAITEEVAAFYGNTSLALYQDGYVVLYDTNEDNRLQYSYNGNTYYSEIKKQAIWNIFDEFAWWVGLERFEGERNASLRQRSIFQLYCTINQETERTDPVTSRHPNSTQVGIRNAILNAAHAKVDLLDTDKFTVRALDKDEIKFIEPNENTMALLNDDGVSLYEEISQFNRDIARTRKWDLDYWENGFRELRYLPHIWDADVDIYQNGVGYHDSLQVKTAKEISQDSTTDIKIHGYAYSVANVDTYIRDHNIQTNIPLTLKKYDNTINPLRIQYRIEAEDLIPISNPQNIKFTAYRLQRTGWYDIDQFVINETEGQAVSNNKLFKNNKYKLTFLPKSTDDGRMEIAVCDRITNGVKKSLLKESEEDSIYFNGNGVAYSGILFHGDKISDFLKPQNIEDMPAAGFKLTSPLEDGTFAINLKDWCTIEEQPLVIAVDPTTGWQDITSSLLYADTKGYTYYQNENRYVSSTGSNASDSFVLNFEAKACRDLTFYIESVAQKTEPVLIDIRVYIAEENTEEKIKFKEDTIQSKYLIPVNDGFKFEFTQDTDKKVKIEIVRRSAYAVAISQIRRTSYTFEITTEDGNIIPYTSKTLMEIPVTEENKHLFVTIKNAQNPITPVIQYIHIGPKLSNTTYEIDIPAQSTDSILDIKTDCHVILENLTTGVVEDPYTTHKAYTQTGDIILDLSSFNTIEKTIPATKKINAYGDNAYYFYKGPEMENISQIWIQGKGYTPIRTWSLADLIQLQDGESVYVAKSFKGLIIKSDTTSRLVNIAEPLRNFCPADRIEVTSSQSNLILQACFTVLDVDHITTQFTGAYDDFYFYDTTAQTYLAYNITNIIQEHTETTLIPSFMPSPKNMVLLSYRISEIVPGKGISVSFLKNGKKSSWTTKPTDTIIIEADLLNHEALAGNADLFTVNSSYINKTVPVNNIIDFQDIIDNTSVLEELGTYLITVPDSMEIVYRSTSYSQTANEDGSEMYVEEDGFNKLKHANILTIEKAKIGNTVYTGTQLQQKAALMGPEGILCWNDKSLIGQKIHSINYTYQNPVALRFKDISSLYKISGYQFEAQDSVDTETEYRIKNLSDGNEEIINLDNTDYFTRRPDKIAVTCTNPCFRAVVNGNVVRVLRIASDNTPVIHNGYYYIDGKEYYYFSDTYVDKADRLGGVSIDDGKIVDHTLYLYKKAINYLQNSKMECNKLDTHCIVNFKKPYSRTNMDPLGHIGACESYAAWEDYNVRRALTTYKNGYAVQFTMQDGGYSLLDLTPFLQGHTTVSCLYNGQLTFQLAREIHIADEQAMQSVYCEPIATFQTYQDIAYYNGEFDLVSYRYYLIVTGNGILDEVLIHDFTEPEKIAAYHVKAIDKLNLHTVEKNNDTGKTVQIEYHPVFMKYNHLETRPDTTMRVGMTADWNITKVHSYDLSSCKKTKCLYRSNAIVAQADGAIIETAPIEIKYSKSVYKIAAKINQYIEGNRKGFTIYAYASQSQNGIYTEIKHVEEENQIDFSIKDSMRFIKFKITAQENRVITDIDLFAIYREVQEEDLGIFNYTDGSAVTRIFSIGAAGNYRFKNVICEEGYDDYQSIYVRGIKKAPDGELVWTNWKDTKVFPDFNGYELFQFKIIMQGQDAQLRIKAFEFEVL